MALKVLVAEDDPATQFLLRVWLEPLGEVIVCENGRDAWNVLSSGDAVDLVVTDHEMPWLSGKALVEKMRSESRLLKIPVIMVTASIAPPDVSDLDIHSFLEKPVKPEALLVAAKEAINSTRAVT